MAKKQYNTFISFLLCVAFVVTGFAVGSVGLFYYKSFIEIANITVFD